MIYTLDTPLSEAIDAAVAAGACKGDISLLRDLAKPGMTIGDLAGHQHAAYWSCWFARRVIGDRFEDGEAIIAKDAWCAYVYAADVIKGRFDAGEAAIATRAWCARRYSKLPGVPSDWREKV